MSQPPCPNFAPQHFYDVETCPVRHVLSGYGGKWPALVLMHLSFGTHRFSELRGAIPDISQRMLSQTLRNLARDGMITRKATPSIPPRVDYSLTPRGQGYLSVLETGIVWAAENRAAILRDRAAAEAKLTV